MGDLGHALTSAAAAVQSATGMSGSRPVQPPQATMPLTPGSDFLPQAGAADYTAQGMAQAQGQQQPGITLDDLTGMPMPQQPQVQAPDQSQAQTPVDNPYTPDDPASLQNPAASIGTDPDVNIVGDAWKPKKESTIARIGDLFLHNIFHTRTQAANIKSAMKNFQEHPDVAVNRLAQVNPDFATIAQQRIAQARAEKAREAYTELQSLKTSGDAMGAALGAVENAPEGQRPQVYQRALPYIRKLAEHSGYPQDMIPDQYDPDAIAVTREKSIPTYQQEQLKLHLKAIQDLSGYRGHRLQQMQQSVDQTGSHQKAEEANADKREAREQTRTEKLNQQEENVKTPYGMGTISKDRNELRLKDPNNPDELHVYKKVGPGNGPGGFAWKHFDIERRKQK